MSFQRRFFRQLVLPVLALVFVRAGTAQQSYRNYEKLSGQARRNTGQPARKVSISPSVPMPFRGWSYPKRNPSEKIRTEYLKRFSRPRARTARAELLKNAARAAAHNAKPSKQFAPSALPGFLLRDSLPTGYIPTAVATGDFNGDGKLDFVVANGGDNNLWVYFGNGNGTFSLPIILPIKLGQSPTWIATGDLRGVGRTDLIVAEADSNSVGIFLANGDGTFVESIVNLPDSATFLLVGDFNNDGKPDVVAPMNDDNSNVYIAMLPGAGNGTFGAPVITALDGYTPEIFWASSADLNGDGLPDLVLTSGQQDISVQVYLNGGNGMFSAGEVVAQNYVNQNLGSVLFDANGDGNTDVIAADSFGNLWVYNGNGDGTFNSTNPGIFSIGDVPYGIAAADVNGDGHMDVILSGIFVNDLPQYGTEAGDQICVLEGDGKGNFSSPRLYRGDSSSYSLAIGDFNGDGYTDAVTANQDSDSASVFLNDGLGGFGAPDGNWVGYAVDGTAVNAPETGAVVQDVDGNGSVDVAFIEYNPSTENYLQLTVLLNDGSGNLSAPVRSNAVSTNYALPENFVLADFRNTGLPDFLAIAPNYNSNPNYISFAPNNGGGNFGPPSGVTSANATGVVGVGDFNHDGKLDFVAAGFGINYDPNNQQGIQVFLGNGDGTFTTGYAQTFGGVAERAPASVYVGDFNRDGKLDLLVLLESNLGFTGNADLYEFLGNGDGTFQVGKDIFPNLGPMVVADVNGDGYPDIVAMAEPFVSGVEPLALPQFSIYIGQPDGTFLLTNTYIPYAGGSAFPQQPYSPIFGNYTPMVADFNGDGALDIAAFQLVGTSSGITTDIDTYVQLMLGNGDGTFTPTYDIFDFHKPIVTAYAADLTGSGYSGLFELNGYRSTYNLLPSIAAPAFQFGISEPVASSQSDGIILLDIASANATTIGLTASDPAIMVPSTVTIPAGSLSQAFNFSVGATFNANHVFSITAQQGSTSAIAYGTVVASGAAGYQAGAPSSVNLGAGQTNSNLVFSAASVNGYTTTVSGWQCLGLSAIAQCQFNPTSLTVRPHETAQGFMTLSVAANTPVGSYRGTVQATNGAAVQNLPIIVNVGDFSLSLSPQTMQVFPTGTIANYNLTAGSINQFNSDINVTCGVLPAGDSCNVSTTTIVPGYPEVITVQAPSGPPGNYQITATGVSAPLTHSASAQLQIWDFNPAVSPTSATISTGASSNFNVTVSPVNAFNGTVNFACLTSSSLVSCSFNPTSSTGPFNGTTAVLTLTASPTANSRRSARAGTDLTRTLIFGLTFPIGTLLVARSKGKRTILVFTGLILLWIPSCGSGASNGTGGGGGGGGGGGVETQTYSITVQVSCGNYSKSAGPITLTVN